MAIGTLFVGVGLTSDNVIRLIAPSKISWAADSSIAFVTTEDRLVEAFSKFGQVEEAKIIMDRVKNRSKGYGYVTFAVEEDARKALTDMNGKLLDGRVMSVDMARPRRRVGDSVPKARGPS